MTGEVGILNVGAGDTKLSFDRSNPAEMIRAARIVKDMIRRGYALLVQTPGSNPPVYQRAYDFDENTCEYIIADLDPVQAQAADAAEEESREEATQTEEHEQARPVARAKKAGKAKTRRVHAADTRSTAVARTAGG